jgi:outer membrane protein
MTKVLFIIALSIITSVYAHAQQGASGTRIGFVNAEVVLKELPEAQQANRNLEDWGSKVQDTLRMMQRDFEARIENYRKQEAMMSADAKRKEEEGLAMLRQRFAQYQEEKLGNQGELARLRESFLAPIREKVAAAVNAVAKEEKIQVVLDKVAGLVLYADDKLDITYKVLDRIKRGEK